MNASTKESKSKAVVKKSKAVVKKPKAVVKKSKAVVKKSKAVVKKSKAVVKKSKAVVKKSKAAVKESKVVDDVKESKVVDDAKESKVVDDVKESKVVDDVKESKVVDDAKESKVVLRKILKLNQGDINNLAIIVANSIKHHSDVNSNKFKKDLKEIFVESKKKTLTKSRIKLICKLCPVEVQDKVVSSINAYVDVQLKKPKSLASKYNLFVAEFCKDDDIKTMDFKQRSTLMSVKWKSLTNEEKQSYSPCEELKRKHAESLMNYRNQIKELKLAKQPLVVM